MQKADSLQFGSYKHMESVLLYGPRGVGKSGIAAHIATAYKFTSVQVTLDKSLFTICHLSIEIHIFSFIIYFISVRVIILGFFQVC